MMNLINKNNLDTKSDSSDEDEFLGPVEHKSNNLLWNLFAGLKIDNDANSKGKRSAVLKSIKPRFESKDNKKNFLSDLPKFEKEINAKENKNTNTVTKPYLSNEEIKQSESKPEFDYKKLLFDKLQE